MFCIKCGKKLPDEANFCMYCGYKVPVVPVEETEAPVEEVPVEVPAEEPETPVEEVPVEIPAEEPETPAEEVPAEIPVEEPETPAEEVPVKTQTEPEPSYNEIALLARRYTWGLDISQDSGRARELCYQLIEMNPYNGCGYYRLALYFESIKDYANALVNHQKAHELGYPDALAAIAGMYRNGKGVEKDEAKSKELYFKAAEEGSAFAACCIGSFYSNGTMGIEEDEDKEFEWFTKSAEGGDEQGIMELGRCYQYGCGCDVDLVKAMNLYKIAHEMFDDTASWRLSTVYLDENSAFYDVEEGMKYREIAIQRGENRALVDMAYDYINGENGLPVDYSKAELYLTRAAEGGMFGAMSDLAVRYCLDDNFPDDYKKTEKWALKAMKGGVFKGVVTLYTAYGDPEFEYYDELKSFTLKKMAAQEGCIEAMVDVAREYDEGGYADYSPEMVVSYLQQAASAGDDTAQLMLGYRYFNGLCNLKADAVKAAELWRKAADAGNAAACSNLGLCYRDGRGVERNPVKAEELLMRAAEMGDSGAAVILAMMYDQGDGVPQDYRKAFELLESAAASGNADAMYLLGNYYNFGKGIQKDKAMSVEWLKKAHHLGNRRGDDLLVALLSETGSDEDFKLIMELADEGVAEAQYQVAEAFGEGIRVAKDEGMRKMWHRKAAANGHPVSKYVAGASDLIYSYDKAEAELGVEYLRDCALIGNPYAMDILSNIYCRGLAPAIPVSKSKGLMMFKECAEKGHLHAQYRLALAYDGQDDDYLDCTNKKYAVYWYEYASRNGTSGEALDAMVNLAISYAQGDGVPVNRAKEAELLVKASELGSVQAKYLMGMRYYCGEIVAQDIGKAKALMQEVAASGDAFYSAKALIYNGLILSDEGKYDAAIYFIEKGLESNVLSLDDRDMTLKGLAEIKQQRDRETRGKKGFFGKF